MTIRESRSEIKRSAKDALLNASSLYVWRDINPDFHPREIITTMLRGSDELLARVEASLLHGGEFFRFRCYFASYRVRKQLESHLQRFHYLKRNIPRNKICNR